MFVAAIILALQPEHATAQQTEDERAREIFEKLDERRRAVTYETSSMEMVIIDRRGRERNRGMKMYSYSGDDVNKTLTVFESPADVRGTGLLNLNEEGTETQLLYLPAVGRVQTVSGSSRNDRFMGSDFTFEDLGNQNPDDFEFELVEETGEYFKLRAVPVNESQYAFIYFYVDAEKLALTKADYFDENDQHIKELTASDYREVKENVWRPDLMVMRDLKAERRTELRWKDRTFDEPIPDRYFTERQLRRGLQ